MCGIIAVLRRPSDRATPAATSLDQAISAAKNALVQRGEDPTPALEAAAGALTGLDRLLRGVPGLVCLLGAPDEVRHAERDLDAIAELVATIERGFDVDGTAADETVERRNATLVELKDALWAVRRDRIPAAAAVRDLAGGDALEHKATVAAYASIQLALSALDRLEVRGRDSAGLTVLVSGVELDAERLRQLLSERDPDPLFTSGAARTADGTLNIVYKAAAEIGELGDNVRSLRAAITGDELLRAALCDPRVVVTVLGHTRWASVGIISEANAHPLNQEEQPPSTGPYVVAALNGDVDNHENLRAEHGLHFADEVTTDAKVIPALVSRRLSGDVELAEAFRKTVAGFDGSVAIAGVAATQPDQLLLALRGSGQALYVGMADDAFVVASEPYGVIEEAGRYLRMDGDTPGNPQHPSSSRGQVMVLDRGQAGAISGIRRIAYDGTELPIAEGELQVPEITTRDIDRGSHPHYLHKEISEAPRSLQKTLRGRIARDGERLRVDLGPAALPDHVAHELRNGNLRRLLVIGQGTAAVAGQGVAAALRATLGRHAEVQAMPATELSGFALADAMDDTLVVAISQSGTTTDTNRTVDLVRSRGARVIAIVNRRGSDLSDKADGVIYTSDGRDVEMSVASTKAFYAQIAAGWLLALALARAADHADDDREHELLQALLDLPSKMLQVLQLDRQIAAAADRIAPQRRYWALVGNGDNRIAAEEVRIKLSELCYKSIACDATEDKKHIDLSSEPLILVCAAGLSGSTADDVAKEVAIYKAHKAAPIVIATEGELRFQGADAVIPVPAVHPALAFVLSTMAGHLFGYRAALAIDGLAQPLRRARGVIEEVSSDPELRRSFYERLSPRLLPHYADFRRILLRGRYDGTLEGSTAARLSGLFSYALGLAPLDSYAVEFGAPGTPGAVVDALTAELTTAIDQLTRPVDAIKHQAKTVTVGISRGDEALLTVPLVKAVLSAGVSRAQLGYDDLRALADLDPAVRRVAGSTRYRITGDPARADATVTVIDQRGAAQKIHSRTASDPRLKGTKHQVAAERRLLIARGRSDDRTVLLVPEVSNGCTVGITLLHVELQESLQAATLRTVLGGYRNRYDALQDQVLETEPEFDETLLEGIRVLDLLTASVQVLADHWRRGQ